MAILRRSFLIGLGSAAAWPPKARPQPRGRVRRIGVLLPHDANDPEAQMRLNVFRQELMRAGWREERNIRIDTRFASADIERIKAYAAELVGLSPDAILVDSTRVLAEVQQATRTVPIVFVQVGDPVAGGFVSNLARPAGNITGFSSNEYEIAGKWLQMLKETAPRVTYVGALFHADDPSALRYWDAVRTSAPALGVQLTRLGVHDASEIERSFDALTRGPSGALIVLSSPFITVHRDLIAALAIKYHLPSVHGFRFFATSGGLMSYGYDPIDIYMRAAAYIDRILKGEKPGDLPVQLPVKYQLVLNLGTAKAIGLTIPQSVLALADEIIE